MKFIKLSRKTDGQPMWVDMSKITFFIRSGDGKYTLLFEDKAKTSLDNEGNCFHVRETPEEIVDIMNTGQLREGK